MEGLLCEMKDLFCEKGNLTVPNILSVMRIILIFPFVISILNDNYIHAGIILILSGISDLLDGIIARKLNQITTLGKILDPMADKLTLMAVMICFGIKFPCIFPFMIILVFKELCMLFGGAILIKQKKIPTTARWYGKFATVVFYFSVIIIIGLKALFGIENYFVNLSLMLLTALCMCYSIFRYFQIFMFIIKNDEALK